MRTPWASHAPPWSWVEDRASAMARGAMHHALVTRAARSWHGGATLEAGVRTRSGTQISAAMARPSPTRTWSACQDPAPTGPWASLDHPARASTDPCRIHPAAAAVAYRCAPALVARGHGWRCVGRSNRSARFPRTRLDASHVHASVAATTCPIPTTVVVDWCCAGPCQTVSASCRHGAEAKCAVRPRRRPCLPIGPIGPATIDQRAGGIYGGRLWGGATCARTQHRHAKAERERQSSHTKTARIDVSYADTAQVRDAPVSVASVPMSARMSWTRCAGSGVRRRYQAKERWKSECVHDTPRIEPTARKRYVTPDAGATSIGSTDKTSATSVTVSVLPKPAPTHGIVSQ